MEATGRSDEPEIVVTVTQSKRKKPRGPLPRPAFCSGQGYQLLQAGVDLGSAAADFGGGMIAFEFLFGEPGLGGASVEFAGSAAALAFSAGQVALGDQAALNRVGRDLLSRGALRLVPNSLRSDLGDFVFGKAADVTSPFKSKNPC